MMNTREALEKKIDENPLDPTPHLVIADWFDENDMPDEAAFRRAMGNWIQTGPFDDPKKEEGHYTGPTIYDTHKYVVSPFDENFPEGIGPEEVLARGGDTPRERPPMIFASGNIGFRTYRDMENAFRNAFMADLRRKRQQKLSRRAHASKLVRWKF